MNLIFNELYIIDDKSKIAKCQKFKSGINVIVSKHGENGEGNYVGKSTLVKSLFHALGADALYDNSRGWEQSNPYIYILDFELNNKKYSILRHGGFFKICDEEKALFDTHNRGELSKFLSDLFKMKILLKDSTADKKYVLAKPFAFYSLNYIDQKQYVGCDFKSFNAISEFSDVYKDIIHSHMGIQNDRISQLTDSINELEISIKSKNEERNFLHKLLESISTNQNSDLEFERIEVLKKEIEIHKSEYYEIRKDYSTIKNKLYELNNKKTMMLEELETIKSKLTSNQKESEKVLKEHICPLCMNSIENYNEVFFKKSYSEDNLNTQLLSFSEEIANIDRKIDLEYKKYNDVCKLVDELDNKIFHNDSELKNIIQSYGLKEYKEKMIYKYGEVNECLKSLNDQIEVQKKERTKLQQDIKQCNNEFNTIINDLIVNYGISIINTNKEFSLDRKIFCGDNHMLSVLWLISLNIVKKKCNNNGLFLPLVFDDPIDRDYDEKNMQTILEMIFNTNKYFNQIIVSIVDVKNINFYNYEINEIFLPNKKFSLLNGEDYEYCSNHLSKILSK